MEPEPAPPLETLAFKSERTGARLLARKAGITEPEALRQILEQRAGQAGLAALLAGRRQQQLDDLGRRADRLAASAARLALKKAGPMLDPNAWLGWFDGSALPNPGRIGIGAVLTGPAGQRIEISRRAGEGNSGEAEYLALIALLEAAVSVNTPALLIRGDSRVVIDDLQPGSKGAAGLADYRLRARELITLLDARMEGARVTLCWIARHKNADADRLSAKARGTLT